MDSPIGVVAGGRNANYLPGTAGCPDDTLYAYQGSNLPDTGDFSSIVTEMMVGCIPQIQKIRSTTDSQTDGSGR